MTPRITPLFLDCFEHGRRFALIVEPPPDRDVRGAVLCVQGLGDEANLSRRVLIGQALRLADEGWTSVIVDLYGCGDSDGDTTEAHMAIWQADLLRSAAFARQHAPGGFVILGVRLGCLLAAELSSALDGLVTGLVFWQPPASGAAALDQWLRLERIGGVGRAAVSPGAAGALVPPSSPSDAPASDGRRGPEDPGSTARASCLSLGGYLFHRDLVEALGALSMRPPLHGDQRTPCPVLMVGVQRIPSPRAPTAKALSELVELWRSAGYSVETAAVQGEPFWASLEPSDQAALVDATAAFIGPLDE